MLQRSLYRQLVRRARRIENAVGVLCHDCDRDQYTAHVNSEVSRFLPFLPRELQSEVLVAQEAFRERMWWMALRKDELEAQTAAGAAAAAGKKAKKKKKNKAATGTAGENDEASADITTKSKRKQAQTKSSKDRVSRAGTAAMADEPPVPPHQLTLTELVRAAFEHDPSAASAQGKGQKKKTTTKTKKRKKTKLNQDGEVTPEQVGARQLAPAFAAIRASGARLKRLTERIHSCGTVAVPSQKTLRDPDTKLRVGNIFKHRKYGYRGVVIGHWPAPCRMDDDWIRRWGIQDLPHGVEQPFYRTLVDTKDRPGVMSTFAAQDNLELLLPSSSEPALDNDSDDALAADEELEPVSHPYLEQLFDDFDAAEGRHKPCKELSQEYPDD